VFQATQVYTEFVGVDVPGSIIPQPISMGPGPTYSFALGYESYTLLRVPPPGSKTANFNITAKPEGSWTYPERVAPEKPSKYLKNAIRRATDALKDLWS